MKARYVIQNHPGLYCSLMVELSDGKPPYEIEHRLSWADAREYCRKSLEFRGIPALTERPEPMCEVFPWVEVA